MENAPTDVDDEAVAAESAPDVSAEEFEAPVESESLSEYDQKRLESFFSNLNADALRGYGDGSDEAYDEICRRLKGEGNPLTKQEFSKLKSFLLRRMYVDGVDLRVAKDSDGSDSLGMMLKNYGNESEPTNDTGPVPEEMDHPEEDEFDEVAPSEEKDRQFEKRSESIAEIFRNGKRGRRVISLTSLIGGSKLLDECGSDSRIIEKTESAGAKSETDEALVSLTSVLNEVKEREAEAAETQAIEETEGASTSEELIDAEPPAEEQKPNGDVAEVVEQPISPEEAPPASPPPKLEDLGEIDEKSRSVLYDLAERWGIEMSDEPTEPELEVA